MNRFLGCCLGLRTVIYVYLIGIYYSFVEFIFDNVLRKKFRDQLIKNRPFENLEAPVAVVTGGTGTIGTELVRKLLNKGFKVVSISHNDTHWNNSQEQYLLRYTVDLSNFTHVRKIGLKITQAVGKVNLLICNAGVMLVPNKVAVNEILMEPSLSGYEPHIALHLLGHAALIESLKPALQMGAGSCRIIFISSSTAFAGYFDSNEVHTCEVFKKYINGYYAYAKSKLALSCYAEQLDLYFLKQAENGNAKPIARVCSLHPGCVPGALYNKTCLPARLFINHILGKLLRNASTAAKEILSTALSDDFIGGAYYERMHPTQLTSNVSQEAKEKLLEQVHKILRSSKL